MSRHLTLIVTCAMLPLLCIAQTKEPIDYVNPNIGGIGQLLQPTYPTVQLPYSMMRVVPFTTPGVTDRYLADRIYGFPVGGAMMMPVTGGASADPAKNASLYDHDLETATPYYYAITLEESDIQVEYTVSQRAVYYRLTFPSGAPARIVFSAPGNAQLSSPSDRAIAGQGAATQVPGGRPGNARYFYAEFSQPVTVHPVDGMMVPPARGSVNEPGTGLQAEFKNAAGGAIGMRVGISYVSVEQAKRNLEREIPRWDFETTRAEARRIWSQALGRIAIKGGTEEERTIFYTALYRTMSRPVDTSEEGRYYSPGDQKVHDAENRGFYPSSGGLWGSYRSLHPIQLLLDPQRQVDYVRSFLALFDQTGRMLGTGRNSMIGHHVAGLILDTHAKGYRDFDLAKAFDGLKKNALEATMLPWRDGPSTVLDRVYYEKGFFPALGKGEKETVPEVHSFERRQAVSVTLEAAYDDWATAQVARLAGRSEDYAFFMKRARNYRNVFDSRVGFMAPKTADGNWKYGEKEFNPTYAGGQGGRDYYTEMNAWIYTFYVPHDVAGLIDLIGGRDAFNAKLDALFTQQYRGDPSRGGGGAKYFFLAQFPDQTGLIGLYAQGNEPSFHIPYLYNYSGQPWKTQRKVREIMRIWYNAGPLGISGDEDSGEESSWYVFSSMGFFPVCPGRPVYDIGSPIFEESRIALAGGKVFTITAPGVSSKNKYIQSATLNGRTLIRPWFEHRDMANGGTLVLQMGPRPNTEWGSAPDAAPPSMSQRELPRN